MKKAILLILLILPILMNAQEDVIKTIFKNDNVESLKDYVKKVGGNECFPMNNSVYSLLALSIKLNTKKNFNFLIKSKVNLNQACANKTPLMYCIKYNRLEMFYRLIKEGALIRITNRRGESALDFAIKYEREDMIKMLEN